MTPLKTLIEMLQEDDDGEQWTAAKRIRDFYPGDKGLDALPHLVATMGRQLARTSRRREARSYDVPPMIHEAVQAAGPKRFKALFELTTHKDPLTRAAAFWLLRMESDNFQRVYRNSKEKSELNLVELLDACKVGVKDQSAWVRCYVYVCFDSFQGADAKLSEAAVLLLADGLEDRKVVETPVYSPVYSPAYQAANSLSGFGAERKLALKALLKAATSQEEALAAARACGALAGLAKDDKKLAPEIVAALRSIYTDTKRKWDFRTPAMGSIGYVGRAAEVAVPELAALLDEPNITLFARTIIYQAFKQLGASAEKGVPALVKALQSAREPDECCEILLALKEIGPAAGAAIKPLEEWMEKATDRRLKQYAQKTIDALK